MEEEELLKTAKQIVFNAEMAKAIRDGRKTETRRAINISNSDIDSIGKDVVIDYIRVAKKPKYKKGDLLWVREPANVIAFDYVDLIRYRYLSDFTEKTININNRFLNGGLYPKWITDCQGVPNGCIKEMARTFLRITDVRVERLQDISDDDMFNDGFPDFVVVDGIKRFSPKAPKGWYRKLWDSTSKDGYKWEDNPFVFVYKFKVIEYT